MCPNPVKNSENSQWTDLHIEFFYFVFSIITVLRNDACLLETYWAETFGWVVAILRSFSDAHTPHTLHASSSSSLKVGETDRYIEQLCGIR